LRGVSDEAMQRFFWIASRSLPSGAHLRDPNDAPAARN